ncbi:MAG: ATP-binding protein [Lachnospiraceae bacterium]|nr:ATP-binding protein [Candidatus Colinaster scatohippi]
MINKIRNGIESIRIFRSFRVRIFLVLLVVGIIPSLIIHAAILSSYEDRAVSVRESEVQNQLKIIANHLITYNYLQNPSNDVVAAELEQISNLYDGRVLIINSNFKVIVDTYNISVGKNIISKEVIRCFKGESITNYDRKNGFIEMTIPINELIMDAESGIENNVVKGVMLTSVSTDTIVMTMTILSRTAWIISIIVFICIFILATLFSRFLTKPFNKVTDAINDVSAGFTDQALAVPDYAETEQIVDAFNRVLSRIRVLDESRQEFVSNVSHELKTPITSIKLLAESLVAQEEVPAELYREFMEDIVGEIDREDKIINDLLELVKLDKTNGTLTIEEVNVNNMIELILKRLKPIAQRENVNLIFESSREVTAQIDDVKMTLAITNFVENAIKYNRENGNVRVLLDGDHQKFILKVEDTGIGIPEESIDHIFERFYRVDKSHSREIGGTGLGLAIARNIILMHRGTIDVESEIDIGTTFIITVPLNGSGK